MSADSQELELLIDSTSQRTLVTYVHFDTKTHE